MSISPHQQWFNKAEEDLAVARLVLGEEFYSHACFLAQQAIEKSLKAFLIAHTNTHPRTHGLVDLLRQCAIIDPSFLLFTPDCAVIDQYYIPTRYPDVLASSGPNAMPGQTEADEAIQAAEKVTQFVADRL
jgi:HEPN domain-containing protein